VDEAVTRGLMSRTAAKVASSFPGHLSMTSHDTGSYGGQAAAIVYHTEANSKMNRRVPATDDEPRIRFQALPRGSSSKVRLRVIWS
jgi:hypothetical protein